jgi:hypothetical protein
MLILCCPFFRSADMNRLSVKEPSNYKFSASPDQIQYQTVYYHPFIQIPDNLTVKRLMKPAYDDVMTAKLPFLILRVYLRISNELLLLPPQLIGVWRSWLAHLHGVQGVVRSSRITPTKTENHCCESSGGFCF